MKNTTDFCRLRARAVTPDRIDLDWPAVAGAEDYVVYRRGREEPEARQAPIARVRTTGYADRDLWPDTDYHYTVEAYGAGTILSSCGGPGRTPADGLSVDRDGSRLMVRGDAFEFTWDADRGGELVTLRQYDGDSWFEVNHTDVATVPGLVFTEQENERQWRLAEQTGIEFMIEKQTGQELIFSFSVMVAGIEIGFRYHVFSQGILFCELTIPRGGRQGEATQGVEAEANMAKLDKLSARLGLHLSAEALSGKMAWGYFQRQFPPSRVWRQREERVVDEHRMMPIAMVEYGRRSAAGCTNRLEFFIEDSPPHGASTWFGEDGNGGFKLEWGFQGRAMRDLYFVCWDMGFLRTRWGLYLGAARKGGFGRVSESRRNNLVGARIYHVGGSQAMLEGRGRKWPYIVPPANLLTVPNAGLPSDQQVRAAARQGADVMVVHQHWMRSGGSNCEPPADYLPRDEEDLKRFVDICHDCGIRVGLYMRGVEKHALFQTYFERFLERDRDGLYVDWNTPYAIGFQGCSELHYSAYNYFLFTRALRQRVGERGFLIGHSGPSATGQASAMFDAYLPGEFKTQRHNFFNSPDQAVHYGFSTCVGTNPIMLPEFATERAVAFYAGLGMSPHVRHGAMSDHHMTGLWRIWRSVPMEQAVMYNGLTENVRLVRSSMTQVHAVVYRVSGSLLLVVAANLGEAAELVLSLDLAGLGMVGTYQVTELSGRTRDLFAARELVLSQDGVIEAGWFTTYEYRGYHLQRTTVD